MRRLKPCPFCGKAEVLLISAYRELVKTYRVECLVCGVRTAEIVRESNHEDDDEAAKVAAIQAWERRAED